MGLIGHETGLCGINVTLVPLEFDCEGSNVIVDLSVLCDLLSQPPVISIGHHHLQYLKVDTGAGEHVLEPDW